MDEELKRKRATDLLALARRSRLKWIGEASDRNNGNNVQSKRTPTSSREVSLQIQTKIPAANCIQSVLNLLSDIVADGEVEIDVNTLSLGLPDEEEFPDNAMIDIEDPKEDDDESEIEKNKTKNTPYEKFLEKLKRPQAVQIVKSLQQFVSRFEAQVRVNVGPDMLGTSRPVSSDDLADMIWTFLDHIILEMHQNPLWSSTPIEDKVAWEEMRSMVEKFIFIKLYPSIFGREYEDLVMNQRIRDKVESLSFLTPEHLDIKSLIDVGDSIFDEPVLILQALGNEKSPGDKIACIKRCSIAIAQALKSAHKDGSLPGADEFLPMLILVIAKCNPVDLFSTVKYLQTYTHPSKFVSEAGYLLTHFVSAVNFLENVDAKALTISPEEFEQSIQKSKLAAHQKLASIPPPHPSASSNPISATTKRGGVGKKNNDESHNISKSKGLNDSAHSDHNEKSITIHDIAKMRHGDRKAQSKRIEAEVNNDHVNIGSIQYFNEEEKKIILRIADASHDKKNLLSGSFLNVSADMVSVGDIPRLLDEYKILLAACKGLAQLHVE